MAAESKVISDRQVVALHTARGVQLDQFVGRQLVDCSWSRESRDTSRAEINVPPTADYARLRDITPWLHWLSIWDDTGQDLYWVGPVVKAAGNRNGLSLTAADVSVLFSYTRCPLTKKWDATDPADIAAELSAAMIALHNIGTHTVARHDPFGDKFDYSTTADATQLNSVIDELVNLGLFWTVAANNLYLGPLPRQTVAVLAESDFTGSDGFTVTRDGRQTFNDVLLRSAGSKSFARVDNAGLNLQTVYTVDSFSDVTNTDKVARQAARYVSKPRDAITLPDNAVLKPNAPVHIQELIPSARFAAETQGLLLPMELTGVDVRATPAAAAVSIRMAAVDDDLPELIKIHRKNSISGLGQ